jgi:protoheme IX farnesyltransferase
VAIESIFIIAAAPAPAVNVRQTLAARVRAAMADYWALTKPEINFLVALATFAGFYVACLGGHRAFQVWLMTHTLLGILLVASGTGTLNQYIERRFDAQMHRTARRPVAAGRIKPSRALWFGIGLSAAGAVYLAVAANVLASLLAVFTLASYLFVYTPLKRITPLCTFVGALPGAMPPLIGYAAAVGRLSLEAWILYLILFLWQFPHFMAIAWMYREDYDRAGYIVLPQGESRFRLVVLQTMLPLLVLILIDLVPTSPERLAFLYPVGALALSVVFFYYGAVFVFRRSRSAARRLLVASILYLPLLLLLMILCKAQRI